MTLLIPIYHINVHFGYVAQGDPEIAYTSLGFDTGAGTDIGEQVAIAQEISDAWQLSFKAMTSDLWAMTGSYVTLGAPEPPYLEQPLTGTTTGEGLSTALPNNCAVLVAKTSVTLGRPGKGRMFIPGLDANSVLVNGTFAPGYRVAWQDAMDEFMGLVALMPDVLGPVLFHDSTSPVSGASVIFGMTVRNQIATQRRRMRP